MNERLSSGQLQAEKAVDWLYFLYLCVCAHIIISVRGKVMQSIRIQSCANFFLSPLDTSSIWQVRKQAGPSPLGMQYKSKIRKRNYTYKIL